MNPDYYKPLYEDDEPEPDYDLERKAQLERRLEARDAGS